MQLSAKLPGQLLEDRIVLRGRNQLPEIAFANSQCDVAAVIGEFRHVEGIAGECHQRRIALSRLETFEVAVLQHQIGAVLVLQHRAMIGNDGDALLGIAAVVDEDAGENAAGLPFPDTNRQVLVELGETSGLQDVGQHVGRDLGVPLLDAAQAVGSKIGCDEDDQERHDASGEEKWAEQPVWGKAGGIHHDDFGIGGELVQRVGDRDHQRDRRDDQNKRRNHQAGDAEKGDDGLALARHQVDAAQRLRNPDHAGEADQDQRKRRERRAENVPVDRPHRYRTIPPCTPKARLPTNP